MKAKQVKTSRTYYVDSKLFEEILQMIGIKEDETIEKVSLNPELRVGATRGSHSSYTMNIVTRIKENENS